MTPRDARESVSAVCTDVPQQLPPSNVSGLDAVTDSPAPDPAPLDARAALRAELRAAVEGLPKRYAPAVMNSALGDEAMVDRAAVLRLIEGDA